MLETWFHVPPPPPPGECYRTTPTKGEQTGPGERGGGGGRGGAGRAIVSTETPNWTGLLFFEAAPPPRRPPAIRDVPLGVVCARAPAFASLCGGFEPIWRLLGAASTRCWKRLPFLAGERSALFQAAGSSGRFIAKEGSGTSKDCLRSHAATTELRPVAGIGSPLPLVCRAKQQREAALVFVEEKRLSRRRRRRLPICPSPFERQHLAYQNRIPTAQFEPKHNHSEIQKEVGENFCHLNPKLCLWDLTCSQSRPHKIRQGIRSTTAPGCRTGTWHHCCPSSGAKQQS